MRVTVACRDCGQQRVLTLNSMDEIAANHCSNCNGEYKRVFKDVSVGFVKSDNMVAISQMMLNNGGK